MQSPKKFLLVALALVLFSWALVPVLYFFDFFVVHNARPTEVLHLLFVWLVGGILFWVVAPTASLPLLGSLLALLAGSTSNISFRLFFGPVPDYIPFPLGAWGNVADLLILVGAPLFLFFLLREYFLARKVQPGPEHC